MDVRNSHELPPGFRFHPTDEELIMYYLRNQATSRPCPVSIIPEVDIYKFDPWELPDKAEFGENEWYFFTPRDRKYPNGARPNRATVSGYWKATGTDKAIHSGSKYVGVKKALVFYKGRPPKGVKTDWIMHEYRLSDSTARPVSRSNGSMRLDEWVLCRIYKKKQTGRSLEQKEGDSPNHGHMISDGDQQMLKLQGTGSFAHLLEMDNFGSISQILSAHNSFNSTFDFQNSSGGAGIERFEFCEMGNQQAEEAKFPVMNNQTSFLNQALFANSMYEFP